GALELGGHGDEREPVAQHPPEEADPFVVELLPGRYVLHASGDPLVDLLRCVPLTGGPGEAGVEQDVVQNVGAGPEIGFLAFGDGAAEVEAHDQVVAVDQVTEPAAMQGGCRPDESDGLAGDEGRVLVDDPPGDRKSTRLNSSHVKN